MFPCPQPGPDKRDDLPRDAAQEWLGDGSSAASSSARWSAVRQGIRDTPRDVRQGVAARLTPRTFCHASQSCSAGGSLAGRFLTMNEILAWHEGGELSRGRGEGRNFNPCRARAARSPCFFHRAQRQQRISRRASSVPAIDGLLLSPERHTRRARPSRASCRHLARERHGPPGCLTRGQFVEPGSGPPTSGTGETAGPSVSRISRRISRSAPGFPGRDERRGGLGGPKLGPPCWSVEFSARCRQSVADTWLTHGSRAWG
jgi:hypothetical protein